VTRIDAIFEAERAINGLAADARRADIAPLVAELEAWMRRERAALSRHAAVAKAMDYMLRRWDGFACFLKDGRTCLSNNAAERALRGVWSCPCFAGHSGGCGLSCNELARRAHSEP
jgi:transposase